MKMLASSDFKGRNTMFNVHLILQRSAVRLIAGLIILTAPAVLSAQQEADKVDDDAQPRLSPDRPSAERLDQTGSVPPPRAIPRLRAEVESEGLFDTEELKQQRQEPPVQRLVAGPDGFGYVSIDSNELFGPVFNFIDISATGTDAGISVDDAGSAALAIGFPFNFYGTNFDQVAMASNGYLNFNLAGDLSDFGNDCPGTNANDPDNSIYILWDDLDLGDLATAAGFFQSFGACPNTEGHRAVHDLSMAGCPALPRQREPGRATAVQFPGDSLRQRQYPDEHRAGKPRTGLRLHDGHRKRRPHRRPHPCLRFGWVGSRQLLGAVSDPRLARRPERGVRAERDGRCRQRHRRGRVRGGRDQPNRRH
jgi:hypothetical protein